MNTNFFKKNLIMIPLLFFLSCSALTISTIKEGELVIDEGRLNNLTWSEDLRFKRTSWYYELTLLYDFLLVELPVHSNYRRWFTSSESINANACARYYVAGVYTSRDQRVSPNDIWREFDTSRLKFTNVNGFYRNLSFTEKFVTNSFGLYKFWGICINDSSDSVKLKIAFPGYEAKEFLL